MNQPKGYNASYFISLCVLNHRMLYLYPKGNPWPGISEDAASREEYLRCTPVMKAVGAAHFLSTMECFFFEYRNGRGGA